MCSISMDSMDHGQPDRRSKYRRLYRWGTNFVLAGQALLPHNSFLPQQQTPQPYTTGWQVLANRDHHTTLSANKQTTKVVWWYTHSQVKRQAYVIGK